MSKENKMRACPFCGGEPIIVEMPFYVHQEEEKHYHVICSCGGRMAFCDTEEEAVKKWNTRVKKFPRVVMPDKELLNDIQSQFSSIDSLVNELFQRYGEEKGRRTKAEYLEALREDDKNPPIGGVHD